MPFLRIQTNVPLATDRADELLAAATKTVSSGLGKPERYVMIALEPDRLLMFAGTAEPAAILELAGIDLDEGQAARLAASLGALLEEQAGVAKDRVFIIFTSVERRMWGWNATTF
jgi:phenylpyruvate tautomerase